MAQRSCLDDDRDKRLRLSQNMQHMEVPPEWSNVPPELKSFKYPGLLLQCKYMYMYVEIQQLDAVKEQMYPQWIVDSEILKCIIRISKILDLGCGKGGGGWDVDVIDVIVEILKTIRHWVNWIKDIKVELCKPKFISQLIDV